MKKILEQLIAVYRGLESQFRRPRIIYVLVFFLLYLVIGLSIYKDYGISWDEPTQRRSAIVTAHYLTSIFLPSYNPPEYISVPPLREYVDNKYGVFFDLLMYIGDVVLDDQGNVPDKIFYLRHLCTFLLFFISSIFLFLIIKNRFNSLAIGLAGTLFLILSPRIFAESFYNGKDIVFLALFIITIYFFIRFLNGKTHVNAFLFALASALMVDQRITGVFVPFLAVIMSLIDSVKAAPSSKNVVKGLIPLFIYLVYFSILTVLFWPYLWENPLRNFINAFLHMSRYPWPYANLYMGTFIKATEIPWHYIPVWLIVTTPILYTIFFLIGFFRSIGDVVTKHGILLYCDDKSKQDILFLLLFLVPLATVVILRSVLYNGWRQMYFIYAPFIIISMKGFVQVMSSMKKARVFTSQRIAVSIVACLIILSVIVTSLQMIQYHPHQYAYFNALAGKSVEQKFDLDYWGLSYRDGLEYIVKNDLRPVIKLAANSVIPMENNTMMLKEQDVRRLRLADLQQADYILTGSQWRPQNYEYMYEIYNITVYGVKIMSVFKLR